MRLTPGAGHRDDGRVKIATPHPPWCTLVQLMPSQSPLLQAAALLGCCFIGLAPSGCKLHPSNNDGGPINLALSEQLLVVARGSEGLDVIDASTGAVRFSTKPEGESDSYDDVASSEGVVLALDADDGYLTSFRLAASGELTAVSRDLEVQTGPYSGVGLDAGKAIVSGGTKEMTFIDVGADGSMAPSGTLCAFRGQPDATMLPGGRGALMSTHFSNDSDKFVDGAEFGVTSIDTSARTVVDTAGIAGAGFTEGGGTPASWPMRANVVSNIAYVAHGGGLEILRVSDDLRIEPLGRLALSIEATDVFTAGETAYVTGVPARVIEVDVSDPSQPRVDRERDLPGEEVNPFASAVTNETIHVAGGEAGLLSLPR